MVENTQTQSDQKTATGAGTGTNAGDTTGTGAGASAGTGTASAGTQTVSGDGIVIDKNKSQEQYVKETEGKYIIPALVREKFPDLVKLIYETESMNDEEREYWMQILPIMTEEQIIKFRQILVNEKEQLAKLDNEYAQESMRIAAPPREIDEEKLRKKMVEIEHKEKVGEKEEAVKEQELLKKLEGMDN